MRKNNNTERGQALILIVFAIVGLIGITGLTVDGGIAYSDRRKAQNAADTAAYAAALAKARSQDLNAAGLSVAAANGYTSSNTVITTAPSPSGSCPPQATDNIDITVTITSVVNTTFARVVGINTMTNVVNATSRSCGTYIAPIFNGQAVVGLKPGDTNCAFNSGESSSARWTIKGSGIFSNGCAYSKENASVTFDPGKCAVAVGNASNFSCSQANQTNQTINYPNDVLSMMPPNPCDGTPGDVGLPQPAPTGNNVYLNNGVYCITDFDAYDQKNIILSNATLYVTDLVFNLKFAGGGGFSGTPTQTGDYNSYYMIIAYDPTPCTSFNDNNNQVIQYKGNGSGGIYGTVLAPSACIDFRGNPDGSAVNTQIIGYIVSSNGTANVSIEYNASENRRDPSPATISLVE